MFSMLNDTMFYGYVTDVLGGGGVIVAVGMKYTRNEVLLYDWKIPLYFITWNIGYHYTCPVMKRLIISSVQ